MYLFLLPFDFLFNHLFYSHGFPASASKLTEHLAFSYPSAFSTSMRTTSAVVLILAYIGVSFMVPPSLIYNLVFISLFCMGLFSKRLTMVLSCISSVFPLRFSHPDTPSLVIFCCFATLFVYSALVMVL
jgi:hypothetical protein